MLNITFSTAVLRRDCSLYFKAPIRCSWTYQGYHVARLAADLRDLLTALELTVSPSMAHQMIDGVLFNFDFEWDVETNGTLGMCKDVCVVGTSMGAAIIWSYIELYGHERLARAVFVDQVCSRSWMVVLLINHDMGAV